MNKFGTLFLLSALFPFSSGAQTLIMSDILQKTSTVFTEQSNLSIPMRAELNSNQRLAGYYTTILPKAVWECLNSARTNIARQV